MRRWRVLALALLVVAASGVFVVWRLSEPSGRKLPAGPLRDQLAMRVVEVLEHDPTFRTEVTREPGPQPVCVASVFGVAPERADAVDEVRTIYTWVNCLWLRPAGCSPRGRPVSTSGTCPGLGMPIALHLGPPVTYEAPEDGEGNPDSVRRIFPKSLEAAAFSHPLARGAGRSPTTRSAGSGLIGGLAVSLAFVTPLDRQRGRDQTGSRRLGRLLASWCCPAWTSGATLLLRHHHPSSSC